MQPLNRRLPQVLRIFPLWISGQFPLFRPLIRFLSGVFGRYPDVIQIKRILIRFGEPEDRLISAGKPFFALQAMSKMPYNPVSEVQAQLLEQRIEKDVEGDHLAEWASCVPDTPAMR